MENKQTNPNVDTLKQPPTESKEIITAYGIVIEELASTLDNLKRSVDKIVGPINSEENLLPFEELDDTTYVNQMQALYRRLQHNNKIAREVYDNIKRFI